MGRKWITDLGESPLLTDGQGAVSNLGRYGVWEERRGRSECIDCGDDLEVLRSRHGLPDAEVILLRAEAHRNTPNPFR